MAAGSGLAQSEPRMFCAPCDAGHTRPEDRGAQHKMGVAERLSSPHCHGPGLASLLWQEQGRGLNYLSVNNGSGGVTWIASPGAERVSLTAFPLTTSRARTLHLGDAGGGRRRSKRGAPGQPSPPRPGETSLRRQGGCLRRRGEGAPTSAASQLPGPGAGARPDTVPAIPWGKDGLSPSPPPKYVYHCVNI